jgi:hypothetical protein
MTLGARAHVANSDAGLAIASVVAALVSSAG